MKRVLIIHIARMGDLIQTSPLITALRGHSGGGVKVDLLVSKAFEETASYLPDVNKVYSISITDIVRPLIKTESNMSSSFRKIKEITSLLNCNEYDNIINLTHTDYSSVLTFLIKSKHKSGLTLSADGYRSVYGSWANYFFNSYLNRSFNRFNLVDVYSRIAGVQPSPKLGFNLTDDARKEAEQFLADNGLTERAVIGVVPGASTREKAWQPELFAQSLKLINQKKSITALVFGAKNESESAAKICGMFEHSIDLCGKTSIQFLAALLEKCQLVLTNDTGPMHLAAAVGTRIIDISTGSALSHETAPFGVGHIVIEPDISCYPCNQRQNCSHVSCHNLISPKLVSRLALDSLNNKEIDFVDPNLDCESVRIYKTDFDANGWWQLRPMQKSQLSPAELFNQSLREMWKRALDGMDPWCPEYEKDAEAVGVGLADSFVCKTEWQAVKHLTDGLIRLVSVAEKGFGLAMKLAFVSGNEDATDVISQIGKSIKDIDSTMMNIAYQDHALMPLVTQFVFGKDSIKNGDLCTLAEQTSELYREIASWGRALPFWMGGIARGIFKKGLNDAAA